MKKETKKFNLTNDYLFKRTFGYVGQEHITKMFLRDLFLEEVDEVSLDNCTITEKDIMTDKMGIMDIKAVIHKNIQCNIEMQVVAQDDIEKRILFYMSSEFKKNISRGDEYKELNKTIAVLVADFELKNISNVPKYATKWNFREENYPEVILTDMMEIYIIELPKLTKYANNTNKERLNLWAEFIKNPEVNIMINENDDEKTVETKETIKEAQEKYEQLQEDKHEMELAELRLKYILDQNSIRNSGYREGKEAGKKDGARKEKLEIAKKLLKQKVDIDTIVIATELSKEEINNLEKTQ